MAHEKRWEPDYFRIIGLYFRIIGLNELADEEFVRIGQNIKEPGTPCGRGLSAMAADEMRLPVGTPVAIGMIDAHAGVLAQRGLIMVRCIILPGFLVLLPAP